MGVMMLKIQLCRHIYKYIKIKKVNIISIINSIIIIITNRLMTHLALRGVSKCLFNQISH